MKILLVDDEKILLKGMTLILKKQYSIITAQTGKQAIKCFRQEDPDLVILDIIIPGMDGFDILIALKKINPKIPVIMLTGTNDIESVVKAVKLGAYNYLTKPIQSQDLFLAVRNALEKKELKDQISAIQEPHKDDCASKLLGNDPSVHKMLEDSKKVSLSRDTPILITGESGSGKGVLAKIIHFQTQGDPGPFVTVNCGAIAKDLVESELFGYTAGSFTGAMKKGKPGRFEAAANGTLFLDEIGVMPISAQAKLLSVIEDRKFYKIGGSHPIPLSARIISATNSNLKRNSEKGIFRQDLYYRLNVVDIEVSPLRKRPNDIILLAEHFLKKYSIKFSKHFQSISPDAKSLLFQYAWPGNIRELKNTLERAVLMEDGDLLLPEHMSFALDLKSSTHQNEFSLSGLETAYKKKIKKLIEKTLKQTKGNITLASTLLDIPVHNLRYQIKILKIISPTDPAD